MTSSEIKARQCLEFLEECGLPIQKQTARSRERIAKAVMSLGDLRPNAPWRDLKDISSGFTLFTRGIITYENEHWGENIGRGSYDDIRRKDLKLPVESQIIVRSNPSAAHNDPTRAYGWNPEFAAAARLLDTAKWRSKIPELRRKYGSLADILSPPKNIARVPITIDGAIIQFSQGKHNDLQKSIIEEFLPRYGHGARVLYVGDTANKSLYKNDQGLIAIGMFELTHGELPDVVAYSEAKGWLYLIEAVYSSGPIDPVRKKRLTELLGDRASSVVWVNAFLSRVAFRKWASELAWDTEVWIADEPDHMLHYNGDRFFGPRG